MNAILEMLTNKHWMIAPDYLQGIRAMLQHNLTNHTALNLPEKKMGYPVGANSGQILAGYGCYSEVAEPFINLEIINGPITRNGDACSYGSRQHRDMMMMAADNDYCLGHVFLINTPGGSAWAKNDYKQAIDYAHAKGQKVIALVDGMCCSAGMYLAALCDERYYNNPKDQIGCVGVMAAFYTAADGSKNQFTDETYHEIYATTSTWKNKEMRDIANDSNDELLVQELDALDAEFKADVKRACPNADVEEHLTGKVFAAEQVDGILTDGQKSLAEVLALFRQSRSKSARDVSTNHNNTTKMNKKYQTVASLMGVDELVVTNEGSHLDVSLLDNLQTNIEALQAEAAKVADLTQQLAEQKAEYENQLAAKDASLQEAATAHANALAAKDEEHAAALAEKDTAMAEKDATIAALNEAVENYKQQEAVNAENIQKLQQDFDGAQTALQTAQQTIAERDQQVSDLNDKIAELQNDPGNEPQAGAAPENNGGGAEAPTVAMTTYVYDPSLTPYENAEAKKKFEAEHKQG